MNWIIWSGWLGAVVAIMFAFHFAFLYNHFKGLWHGSMCVIGRLNGIVDDQSGIIDSIERELKDEQKTSANFEVVANRAASEMCKMRKEMDGEVDADWWREGGDA